MSNEVKTPRSVRNQKSNTPFVLRIWQSLVHNWGWKLGCLLVAVGLWTNLMASNKTLMRPKEFTGVTVSASETAKESLKSRGFVVVSGLEEEKLGGFTLRVNVPMQNYMSVTAENFSPRVNLSRINSAGTQKVDIITSDSTTYGTTAEIVPSSVEITVEQYVTRSRIPVGINYIGSRSDQFYYPAATCDPLYITIAGPRSLVSGVARCLVDFDRSALPLTADTKKIAVTSFRLVDQEGNEIPRDMIRITPLSSGMVIDSIIIEQEMYAYQQLEVSTDDVIVGQPAEGYRIRSVSFSPAWVDVAPEDPETDLTGTKLYAASPVDITGISLTQDYRVDLSRPAEAKIKHMKREITWMTVEVEPIPKEQPEESEAQKETEENQSGEITGAEAGTE